MQMLITDCTEETVNTVVLSKELIHNGVGPSTSTLLPWRSRLFAYREDGTEALFLLC